MWGPHFESLCPTPLPDGESRQRSQNQHQINPLVCNEIYALKWELFLTIALYSPSWPHIWLGPTQSLEAFPHEGELISFTCLVRSVAKTAELPGKKKFFKGFYLPTLTITTAFEMTWAILRTASLQHQYNPWSSPGFSITGAGPPLGLDFTCQIRMGREARLWPYPPQQFLGKHICMFIGSQWRTI